MSNIEWTDKTINPVIGCSPASEGCAGCWAQTYASRLAGMANAPAAYRRVLGPLGKWNGKTFLVPEALEKPAKWKKPRKIFVCSMGDLFHASAPLDWADQVMAMAAYYSQHTFMLLTKRPGTMQSYFSQNRQWKIAAHMAKYPKPNFELEPPKLPLPNVWLGTTVEKAGYAHRIKTLLQTPAAIRFVSLEPLLGPIGIKQFLKTQNESGFEDWGGPFSGRPKLDWVIAGGETGPGARPMHPDWVRSVRDQCLEAGTPFFFKGWGQWLDAENAVILSKSMRQDKYPKITNTPSGPLFRFRKKGGRLLDGEEHKNFPKS